MTVLTEAMQDYLKTIWRLAHEENVPVTTTALADALGVRPASTTNMLKRLAALHLVKYEPYRGVELTEAGEKVALEVVRHHRLLELYLTEALGFPPDEVHEEAERLEHHISEAFEQAIAEQLGHPTHDPHGDPIPTPDLRLVSRPARPLSELDVGQEGYIRRVRISAPERVEALAAEGVAPNVRVRVLDHREQACVVQIVVSGREVVIVPDEACDVLIEPLPEVENEEG
ncbi:metal-dependent transcriptional regulator [Ardenticatena maritima]|uniref:Manganese transport regulator n=3 Tax=Ardenticatena maritima TaxID=872965 RepID=A0A0P6Y9K5_9CHLR|nr:metal-dependent transcriptional regulator [Ardenticatena maritima]KPL89713.1 hypothetical protein SE16_04820 [Ardenticatena maritima]